MAMLNNQMVTMVFFLGHPIFEPICWFSTNMIEHDDFTGNYLRNENLT